MIESLHLRLFALMGLAAVLACAVPAEVQTSQSAPPDQSKPLVLKPDLPGLGKNHRLILKDGSYQIVREYQVVGDRVHYFSQERGDWEDLPADLVDWDATRKWEQEHSDLTSDQPSPAMKEAETIDKEETDERADARARMPEVAPGLELPDQDGVFALDTYHGTPELVELLPKDVDVDAKTRHGLATLNPLAGQRASLELSGAHAKIHLHVNDPAVYLSLGVNDQTEPVLSAPFTVNTATAAEARSGKHGAHSAQSGFAIVRLNQRQAVRLVGAIHVASSGAITQEEDVIPATVEVLAGKHWLRIEPKEKLVIGGEYAVVEILSPSEMSPTVWDFRVDPTEGDNPGSLTPILKQASER